MITLPRVTPGGGLLAVIGQILATIRAEIVMQWRRWGFWLAFSIVMALLLFLTLQAGIYLLHLPPTSLYVREHFSAADLVNIMILGTTIYGSMFFVLIASLLVVDRMVRDRRLGVTELQQTAPMGHARYVLGKFLGNYLAVFVPALLGYLICGAAALVLGWPAEILLKFLLSFALVFIPASLAALGLTFLLATFLPLRVVQVGFSLLWLYFNTGLGIYGFGSSIFNPGGLYILPVFFPTSRPMPSLVKMDPSLQMALLNIAVLLLTSLATLCLTYASLVWQQRRGEQA